MSMKYEKYRTVNAVRYFHACTCPAVPAGLLLNVFVRIPSYTGTDDQSEYPFFFPYLSPYTKGHHFHDVP